MSIASQVKLVNASMLGIFSLYLIGRGVSPAVIAIPAISALKYVYLSESQSPDRQKAHYLSWFLTTPIMLWLIFSLNHLSLETTTLMILLNQLMIASGYFAAVDLEKGNEKSAWNWFWLGLFCIPPHRLPASHLFRGFRTGSSYADHLERLPRCLVGGCGKIDKP